MRLDIPVHNALRMTVIQGLQFNAKAFREPEKVLNTHLLKYLIIIIFRVHKKMIISLIHINIVFMYGVLSQTLFKEKQYVDYGEDNKNGSTNYQV